jgi:thiol-disulfide isomerase/thioredoxin
MGPTVALDTGDELLMTNPSIVYRLGEPFAFNSQIVRFDSFDYCRKKLIAHIEPLDENKRIEGYKVGYYLPEWNTDFTDALGIQRDKPFILYFGGSWCPPCLEELPRWKGLAAACDKHGIGTASVAVLNEESKEIAGAYLARHEFPGLHIVEDIRSKGATLREYLQISSFPSYIFVDSSGEILLRVETRGDRDTKLPSFLSKYISEKRK